MTESASEGDQTRRRRDQMPRRRRPKAASRDISASLQGHTGQIPSTSSQEIVLPLTSRQNGITSRQKNTTTRTNINTLNGFQTEMQVNGSRSFGGNLTMTGNEGQTQKSAPTSSLHADAPVFQPGDYVARTKANPTHKIPGTQNGRRKLSRSNASDVTTRIHEDIDNRQYECPICTSEVLRHSKIWSCHTCWTVFHLSCIKTWSSNTAAAQNNQNDPPVETGIQRLWRCPGCNLPQHSKPSSYTCWCGKDHDPRPVAGLPPHSCGQTCGRSRPVPKKCPHPCESVCHSGPCPPCFAMGPVQSCFCGKQSGNKRCVDTDYDTGWSCGASCGDVMPCGEHTCPDLCHEGLCGACRVRLDGRCYCGKQEKSIFCCDREEPLQSSRLLLDENGQQISETWTGIYECGAACDRLLDCGIHRCSRSCHGLDGLPSHCPRSPDVVSTCPCGKSNLADIIAKPRETCSDPIPNCSKICQQIQLCGHVCQQNCHIGPCSPCLETVMIACRCGRTKSSTICHQGAESAPQCTRLCRTTLNCGRHECGESCCPGEHRATERLASKRKHRLLNSAPRSIDETFEAEHICTRVCGRVLKCGTHNCEELCHRGPCSTCREAIFNELPCNCGRTVLQPPLHCGTKPPPCRYECRRDKACGHPQIPHNCHFDDDPCPNCPFLTEKACLCGRKTLKNQQCWFNDVRCGEICGLKLRCGSHTCQKTCHKSGVCEDATISCRQLCGKSKRLCGHPCDQPCHAPYPCNEKLPCNSKIIISCSCQSNRKELVCKSSMDNLGNVNQTLECNDECARLERNRKLASAFSIDQETHTDDHIPYSKETLILYQANVNWSQTQEREFRVFANSEDEKRLRFKPMSAQQREFLHHLAEDFGFDSESLDPEPHRHVLIFKSRKFVSAPAKSIADCVRIRQNQRAFAAETRALAKSSNIREPYNGFLLTNARFALTIDEIAIEVAAVQGPNARLQFQISFLPSDEVGLSALGKDHTERTIDLALKELKLPLARAFGAQKFGSLQLCRFDSSNNITRREMDTRSEGGWSQVAAKAAPARQAEQVPAVGVKSSFTVLGNLSKKKVVTKNFKKEDDIVDDWEIAEKLAEQQERVMSGDLKDVEGSESKSQRPESLEVNAIPDVGKETTEETS